MADRESPTTTTPSTTTRPSPSINLLLPQEGIRNNVQQLAPIQQRQKKKREPMTRESFIQALLQADPQNDPTNTCVRSPAVQRAGLQGRFRDLYFSKDGTQFPGFEMIVRGARSSRAFTLALDTECLLTVGYSSGDHRLLFQASKAYSYALQSLREEIASPNPILIRLMATVHTLEVCEMFACVSEDGTGWRKHAQGINYIVNLLKKEQQMAQGPAVGGLIKADVRVPFSLWDSLLSRKSSDGAKKLYSPVFGSDLKVGNLVASFAETTMQVAGVLEICDNVLRRATKTDLVEVTEAIERIMAMEGALHAYLLTFYKTLTGSPYRVCHIQELPRFKDADMENSDDLIFPHVYTFPDLSSLIFHISYWLCLLCLRQTALDLRRHVPARSYPFTPAEAPLAVQTKAADECADNLCMSVAYSMEEKNGYLGLISAIPAVQLAAKWYKRQNDGKKLEWCARVMERLEGYGLRTPDLGIEGREKSKMITAKGALPTPSPRDPAATSSSTFVSSIDGRGSNATI